MKSEMERNRRIWSPAGKVNHVVVAQSTQGVVGEQSLFVLAWHPAQIFLQSAFFFWKVIILLLRCNLVSFAKLN